MKFEVLLEDAGIDAIPLNDSGVTLVRKDSGEEIGAVDYWVSSFGGTPTYNIAVYEPVHRDPLLFEKITEVSFTVSPIWVSVRLGGETIFIRVDENTITLY